jgi:hypothetical protein
MIMFGLYELSQTRVGAFARCLSVAIFAISLAVPTSATSQTAIATANVNLREGPGTNFGSMGQVPKGAAVTLEQCNESGEWCAIRFGEAQGFVAGQYLSVVSDEASAEEGEGDELAWPRAFSLENEAILVLHQPQISEWNGGHKLSVLIAAEYRETEEAQPVFGVIGLDSEADKNSDAGTITLTNMRVSSLDFTGLEPSDLPGLTVELKDLLPVDPIEVAEQHVLASLANYDRLADVEGLDTTAPRVFTSTEPAVLVQTDGQAVFAPIAGVDGLEFVVNTNWDAFRAGEEIYLRHDSHWLKLISRDQGFVVVDALPDVFGQLPDDGNWEAVKDAIPPVPYDGTPPGVFYSDVPAELILFDGEPRFEAIPGTDLEWASNTQTDVFRYAPTGEYYVLFSGRWFRSTTLDASLEFASDSLPRDFQHIPSDAPYAAVRASVPDTSESTAARLRASIPETAWVEPGSISPDVAYDGDPQFEAIEDTSLHYAVNTSSQVIQVGDAYYAVQDGVWFVSNTPEGPWELASAVPDEVYEIPASSPVHNVTYVQVYDEDDDTGAVLFGFTAGYLFAYLAYDSLVYGPGWYHRPYWRYARFPIYFPRPFSYGIGAYYNPIRGTFGRYGYHYGPYRGIAARTAWNPVTGSYVRGAKAYGPVSRAGFVQAYNPRTGNSATAAGAKNIYGSWGSVAVRSGSDYARISASQRFNGSKSVRWTTSEGTGFVREGRRGNVFAGTDGQVYRKDGDQWQSWNGRGDGWQAVDHPPANRPDRTPDLAQQRNAETIRNRAQNQVAVPPARTSPTLDQMRDRAQPNVPRANPQPRVQAPPQVQRDLHSRQLGERNRSVQNRTRARPSTRAGGIQLPRGRR